jgi:hypothetical protein
MNNFSTFVFLVAFDMADSQLWRRLFYFLICWVQLFIIENWIAIYSIWMLSQN